MFYHAIKFTTYLHFVNCCGVESPFKIRTHVSATIVLTSPFCLLLLPFFSFTTFLHVKMIYYQEQGVYLL